ncbi:MAG: type II toxin-antitoxin system VapC family toxin [Candidatus Parabeggiatoa sp. nov. 2]|nr:MAG: twitching motility protein PilT [Beggiatoa sp. 4572_84]RKZ59638.1 MAG: type II toxin-antitoxin system VapC family toxin [Gammaproteobacteria bacterium]HEC85029.1 type II toxin-antitoxin system VapC family toxin [Thioploca sp.]
MILLDTHAWIWWVTESMHLSKQAAQAIAQADRLGVHIISCWEVAMLVEKGRIGFNRDVAEWVDLALQRPKVTLVPFEPKTAVLAASLKDFHGDPADRFLVATCLTHNIPLVTKDQKIHDWQQISVIW